MPRRDGTGPNGRGPIVGNQNPSGQRQGGVNECTCPKCGYKQVHQRGVPCSQNTCPECKTTLKGAFCL
jgi:hypothetical protein